MITPTVGRIVWFYPASNQATSGFAPADEGQPLAGIIAKVLGDRAVHLTVFDGIGIPHSEPYVQLVQEGDQVPGAGRYATWMPYQIGQAKKDASKPAPGASLPGYCALLPHQQRVVDEKCELDARLAKLVPFFDTPTFAALDEGEKARLERQERAMCDYSNVLRERIAAFEATASTAV